MSLLLFLLDSVMDYVNCVPHQAPAAPCVQIQTLAGARFSPVVHVPLAIEAPVQGGEKVQLFLAIILSQNMAEVLQY